MEGGDTVLLLLEMACTVYLLLSLCFPFPPRWTNTCDPLTHTYPDQLLFCPSHLDILHLLLTGQLSARSLRASNRPPLPCPGQSKLPCLYQLQHLSHCICFLALPIVQRGPLNGPSTLEQCLGQVRFRKYLFDEKCLPL